MMGYGARRGVAESVHDPLHARALYLAGGGEALLIECDLCLLAPAQADAVRARIAARTGVSASGILVGCIHTHSGPDTGLGAILTDADLPEHVPPILDAIVEAGCAAHADAAPARLGVGHARAAIGRNRRAVDGPLDEDVLVLRVDDASGAPRAVLYLHGCHPTALGHENLAYSADWPAAANRAIEARHPGALAIFALGAHADVDPRTRGLLDLAIPGQSVGVGFDEAFALGRELGEAVAEVAGSIETRSDVPIRASAVRVPISVHPPSSAAPALEALGLPADSEPRTGELFRLEQERTAGLPEAERRERIARVRRYLRDRTAQRFAGGREPEVEAQVLRLGAANLLALPAEPTVDVGLAWKQRMGADAAVVGIGNGWIRYLPHPRNFEEPLAHQKYEILQSTLVPDAAQLLLDEAEALAAGLAG